jgi:hypothetical protein
MAITIDAEKYFNKIQCDFMLKSLKIVGIHRIYFNIIKAMYDTTIFNIILNGEKLKQFPLKSGMKQVYPCSPVLFNRVLKFLIRVIKQEKEIKWIPKGRQNTKYPHLRML